MFVWHVDKNNYVITKSQNRIIKQHRLVMNVLDFQDVEIDHMNFDTCDNRKNNLRYATRSQNCAYQRLGQKNRSGVVGVYFMKSAQKWAAQITSNGKRYYLGCFKTFDEAVQARLKAEQELHGEFGINLSKISNQAANSGRLND